jgi:hypothetical protein
VCVFHTTVGMDVARIRSLRRDSVGLRRLAVTDPGHHRYLISRKDARHVGALRTGHKHEITVHQELSRPAISSQSPLMTAVCGSLNQARRASNFNLRVVDETSAILRHFGFFQRLFVRKYELCLARKRSGTQIPTVMPTAKSSPEFHKRFR